MADDMLNRKIGRYEIQEHIGEGAMAMVYRAFDPEINRSVACKILKADHCVDEEYMSRFLREAKAAGALSHASIVTVFDVGRIDESPYIMMELLQGKDLGDLLKDKPVMGIRETLTIAIQLAKALDYAHSTGIVHRDIKPDNIIVLPDNETIKVADFGIARMNENEEAQKTQVGSVLGTPRYMSPEQALGDKVDGRSDLFSVGVIIYEMLTGTKAFDGSNMGTLMLQIAQKQPAPLKTINPDVPSGMRQIVQKLLQKSPDKRFQTGAELAAALTAEINTLRDQQEEQGKHKYIPLKIKWTLSAVAIVSLVLLISMNVVFSLQSSAMTKQAVDSGSSFAKFIATETAIPLLSEDWITLETFINDAASRDTFAYLVVTDRSGIIRGASDTSLVGQTYVADATAEVVGDSEDVFTTSSTMEDGTDVFNVTTSILFQNTKVGKIILGLSQETVDDVKSATGWLMFILAIITISSVAVVMFIFGGLISRPMKAISAALNKFETGDFDTRISLSRQDEIGEVFENFNKMASSIQTRYTEVADELAQSGIQKPAKTPEQKLATSAISHLDDQDVDDATIMASSVINHKASGPKKTDVKKDNKQTPVKPPKQATQKSSIVKDTAKAPNADTHSVKESKDKPDVAKPDSGKPTAKVETTLPNKASERPKDKVQSTKTVDGAAKKGKSDSPSKEDIPPADTDKK